MSDKGKLLVLYRAGGQDAAEQPDRRCTEGSVGRVPSCLSGSTCFGWEACSRGISGRDSGLCAVKPLFAVPRCASSSFGRLKALFVWKEGKTMSSGESGLRAGSQIIRKTRSATGAPLHKISGTSEEDDER